jgi:hypothetical protein
MSDEPPGTPGANTGLGIVLMDEPAGVGVTTFADNGEVLLTFNARTGADFSQIIIGLSPRMVVELTLRLSKSLDHCAAAIRAGKGGRNFG